MERQTLVSAVEEAQEHHSPVEVGHQILEPVVPVWGVVVVVSGLRLVPVVQVSPVHRHWGMVVGTGLVVTLAELGRGWSAADWLVGSA